MTEVVIDPEFPDTYYQLFLTSVDGINSPILQVLPVNAKLVDGVYCHRNSHTFPASELMRMTRNDRGSNMCRGIACLEQDIPLATERLRVDILKEAQHMFEKYQEKLALFQMQPFTTEAKRLWTTAFADQTRELLSRTDR